MLAYCLCKRDARAQPAQGNTLVHSYITSFVMSEQADIQRSNRGLTMR